MADGTNQGGTTGNPGGNQGDNQNRNQGGPMTSDGIPIVGDTVVTVPNHPGTVPGTNPTEGENNNSQADPIGDIFNPQPPEGTDQPGTNPSKPDANNASNPMEAIQNLMGNMKPRETFTEEMIAKAGGGDMDGMNKMLEQNHQGAVQDATEIMTQVLSKLIPELLANVDKKIKSELHTEKGNSSLANVLPELMTPELKPVTEMFYSKAMEVTNGDFTKAIDMTQKAVNQFSNKAASLQDVGDAPANEGVREEQDFMEFFGRQ